jgi:hypothetical protein
VVVAALSGERLTRAEWVGFALVVLGAAVQRLGKR